MALHAFQENLQIVIHDHLTGRMTRENVKYLERLVFELQSLCKHLMEKIEALDEKNEQLSDKLEASDHFAASHAGKILAAHKKARSVRH